MLRRNRKKDEASSTSEDTRAFHMTSPSISSSHIFRTNSPPIFDPTGQPLKLPNTFSPHAKTSTAGSNSSGSGQTSGNVHQNASIYPQSSAASQTTPSSSTKFGGISAGSNSPKMQQDRQLGSHQSAANSSAHVLHPSAVQNQYRRGSGSKDNSMMMMPPASRSLKGTRHHQHVYPADGANAFSFSQSVDALGQDNIYAIQTNEVPPPQVQTHHQPQQTQNVGRSQSALNFLLSKARASFSSSSASASSSAGLAGQAQSGSHVGNSASVMPSASLSSVQASGSAPSHDEFNSAGRADGMIGRNRVASESSGSLLHTYGPRPTPRARPSFGEESAPASSPTKRGFFNRERKASLVSLGKSGNAAKQAFSNSPLGRAPLMRYESPGGRSQSTTNFISQFSKSQTDLHSRADFPSPPSATLDLPNLLPPSQSSGAMARDGHSRVPTATLSASGDSAFLRSPSPNIGFSKSVDDLNRASPPTASPDFLINPKSDRENLWSEHGLAPTERGRASDTGALGIGRTRGSSMTMDASPGALHGNELQESQTYDSPRHQRKSSRPKINVRPAEVANVAPALISPREIGRPALGPGVTYDGLLYRNMNVSMSINQLNGKEKEKDIGKGWKPFRVIMKEGKMYFYKPSSSVADDIKLLFPTCITPAELASRRDHSPSRLSPNSPGLSASSSAPGLTMEDLKRNKLSTRDLLAATSSSQEQDVRSNLRRTQKDSRLSAIMDTSEAEALQMSSMQPASLPGWAHANAHADLLLSSVQVEPESWVDRIRGGPAIALAHEYVYATQSNGPTSQADNAAMLHFIVDQMQEVAMPLQVFLSAVRKWATIALSTRANTAMDEELEHEIVRRLEAIRDADLPSTATDDATRNALQRTIAELIEQFHVQRSVAPEGSRSAFIPVRSDHVRAQASLNVPSNEGHRQLSTSAPSQFSTSPVLPPSAPTPSEKETRRMTAFFRGAVRPMGLMSSSSSTLGNEQLPPRSYNELLASVSLQKPASGVACGSGRVSVWHNAQRSYVFNVTPADGGHVLLQAHNAQEMQEWCNAIEQASKAFAKSVVAAAASTEMTRKGSGGIATAASSTPGTPKTAKAPPLVPLYGTDVKILAEHEGSAVPLGLSRMLEEVEKRGLREQGLYRISGAKSAIEALKYALTTQPASNVNLTTGEWSDVHTIAGAIKQWFRDLPEPAIPFSSYHALIAAERIESEEDRLYAFRDILWDFPRAHFELLKRISAHLAMVCAEGAYNLMAPHNIGLVFGTSLLNPPPGPASVAESFGNIGKAAHIVKIIVTTHEWLFEPEPEPEDEEEMNKATAETTNVNDEDRNVFNGDSERSASASEEAKGAESAQVEHERNVPSSNDANVTTDGVEGQSDSATQDLGESTLTVSTFGADTSGNTTVGYDVEPITPADGSEVGLSHSHDDSTPRQSLVESESPAPWLENPLLTVDEGTIDSHASESSMMRAVLGAHHVSPVKSVGEHAFLHALQHKPSSPPEDDRVSADEENERAVATSKMLSAKSSHAELRPSLSRANSSQQVFLDVDEELPGGGGSGGSGEHLHAQLVPQQQHRSILTSEPHDRTVESVYLDATDAMAILQSNYDEERQENGSRSGAALRSDVDSDRHSEEEVEEVLEH